MKSPRFNISFPDSVLVDLAAAAERRGVSASCFIRRLVVEQLESITGKTYIDLQHGGSRKRKPKSNSR